MAKLNNNKYSSKGVALEWQHALKVSQYKTALFIGLLLVAILVMCLPAFFHVIQQRPGYQIHDWLVDALPSANLSIPIFVVLWSVISLGVLRAFQQPQQFLTTLYGMIFLLLFRYLSISLVALDPPIGLIPITDPVSNLTYGHADFITKDLFFSGHTSSMFLAFLCLQRRPEKIFALVATFVIAIFVLVQHVHYTIDVLAAPFFTYLSYRLGKKMTQM
ncbi:MAG: phosphatase PAP2-related protein [Chitinophagaceae bacterium]